MQTPLNVLLVEDNESDGALVVRQLEKANYAVNFVRVESRQEMATALESQKWDIVISDFSLPQFTAHDSLKVLQDSGKDIPFIVVSGTIGEATAVVMMKSGAQDYLMKDNLTRLAPAVGRELADANVRRKRIQAETELRESEAKFRAVWENSTDAIGVNSKGLHEFVNPAYVNLFGYDNQNDLIGKPIIGLIAPEEKNRIEEFIKLRPVEPGVPLEYETVGLKKDGTKFDMDVKVSLFDYNNEKHALVIIRDITERKKSEERLREELAIRTQAEIRAEESNLVKSTLMMNMSHEVRTPLNAILGFSTLIVTESADEEIRKMATRINNSGERLLKTLDDILELTQLQSNSQSLTTDLLDLNSELQVVVKNIKQLADQKKLELIFIPAHQPIKVNIDKRLFHKAISELLNNAVKFTSVGQVIIKLNKIPAGQQSMVEIRISDTGIGISKEYHQAIFESFRQVSGGYSRSYEGTGLGLTIAKKIVEMFQGELIVESEIGKGSVFMIRLPESVETVNESQNSEFKLADRKSFERRQSTHDVKETHILLVEDNEDNVYMTKEFCKGMYVIDAVDKAKDAIQLSATKTFDVILMDINLGLGMNGLEAMHEIRKLEKNARTPVIALTGFTSKEDQQRILDSGCDFYLGKPFTKTEILEKLNQVFETCL